MPPYRYHRRFWQLDEVRKLAGRPSRNGNGVASLELRRRLSRRPRARAIILTVAVIILLANIPRSCEVIFKPAARIEQAEAQIRELGAREGWPDHKIAAAIERLHERYKPERE